LRRLVAILTGYASSCLVTSILWPIAFVLVVMAQGQSGIRHDLSSIFWSVLFLGIGMAPYFAVICSPALIAIGFFEWGAERRWWPYATFGASMAAVMSFVVSTVISQPPLLAMLAIVSAYTVIGVVAATVYWLIAFRLFSATAS
jgi:hypothetical protein